MSHIAEGIVMYFTLGVFFGVASVVSVTVIRLAFEARSYSSRNNERKVDERS